jgi:hypothetical protein
LDPDPYLLLMTGSGMPKNIRIRNTGYKNEMCCAGEKCKPA